MAKITKYILTPPPGGKGKKEDVDLGMSLEDAQKAFSKIRPGWTVKRASIIVALVAGATGLGVYLFRRWKRHKEKKSEHP